MLSLLLYYAFLPLFAGGLIVSLVRKYGTRGPHPAVQALLAEHPMQPKTFRVARVRPGASAAWLGDFETLDEAVDAAYQGRRELLKKGGKGAFLVLDAAGDTLQEIDA